MRIRIVSLLLSSLAVSVNADVSDRVADILAMPQGETRTLALQGVQAELEALYAQTGAVRLPSMLCGGASERNNEGFLDVIRQAKSAFPDSYGSYSNAEFIFFLNCDTESTAKNAFEENVNPSPGALKTNNLDSLAVNEMTSYLIAELGPLLDEPSLSSGLTALEYVEQQRGRHSESGSYSLAAAYQNIKRAIEDGLTRIDITNWDASINSGSYFESISAVITRGTTNEEVVCKIHQNTGITADQRGAECVVFNGDQTVGVSTSSRTSFAAKLAIPSIHDITDITVDGTDTFTIEGSSNRCSYKLEYRWIDATWWSYYKKEYWSYSAREEECWR